MVEFYRREKKNMVANALSKRNNHEENEREVSNFGVVVKVMSVGHEEVYDFYKNDHFL
jgi:hypothetical protein